MKFIKEQEAGGLLSKLTGIKALIPSDLWIANIFLKKYKMNAIVKKLSLAGVKFISQIHLKQLGLTYSAGGPSLNIKK